VPVQEPQKEIIEV